MIFFKYILLLHQVSKESDNMFTISEAFGLYFAHFFQLKQINSIAQGGDLLLV